MENLKNYVNNEIDRNAQDFDNSDSVNLSLSKEDFLSISTILFSHAYMNTLDKSHMDEALRLRDICVNIYSEMCSDDELAVENGAVVYKHV